MTALSDPAVNILLVDDEPANLLALEAVLGGLGQNLVRASSGEEALRRLSKDDFAVVLLDLQMPALDGFETAQRIRSRERSRYTPVIFLTAHDSADFPIDRAYRLGAVDYLVKPLVPDILRAKVAVFVELARRAEQVRGLERQAVERQLAEKARAEAEEAARRLTLLVEASASLTRSLSLGDVLAAVLDLSNRLIEADAYAIWRLRPAEGCWEVARSSGLSEAFLRASSRVADTGQPWPDVPLVAEDVMDEPLLEQRREVYQAEGIASLLLTPLRVHGAVSGTLVFYYHQRRRLGEVTVQLATALGNLAAAAVGTAELYERQSALRRQAEQGDRAKGVFLATLAHELRNPLAPILPSLQVLRRAGADPAVRLAEVERLERQVRHLGRMVDDLVDVARLDRGRLALRTERLDLARLARTAALDRRALFEQGGLVLAVEAPQTPLWVQGDALRLTQVLNNLLDNAAQYTSRGGRVEVRARADEARRQAAVSVADTGAGIEPALLPRVFHVFAQGEQGIDRARGGLGLGLAMVHGLVELHGGTVEAASEGLGRGSVFTVRLPLEPEPEALTEVPKSPSAIGVPMLRVLVVEDNPDAATSLQLLLEVLGHEVRVARTGPEGVEEAGAWKPDAVISDIGLPGIDGYEVARQVRRLPGMERAVLVALTGYGSEEDRRRSRESGFDRHLVKPAEAIDLQRALAIRKV
jgi:signal transduction histidine kinase